MRHEDVRLECLRLACQYTSPANGASRIEVAREFEGYVIGTSREAPGDTPKTMNPVADKPERPRRSRTRKAAATQG